ncbi:MAG: exodeoxyribonuclease VII large subunit [Peptococcaceae bacterium]|nr:exodeoxyribonuclease VII large subunit [Peptococcaceae bacterium]
MPNRIFSVTEINYEINEMFKKDYKFWNCWVTGEISNFKDHISSGHWYFTLKDANAGLRVVMFKTKNSLVRFAPQNGMEVIIRGSIRLYEREGNIQLYAEEMFPIGVGTAYIAFEQLKNKLAEEGLFAPERKKPIPKYPRKIALVTSLSGAALKDILNIAKRRNPQVPIIIIPSSVQGETAAKEIAKAIDKANNLNDIDLIIVGRGGGSIEELAPFNTETVARAIANSNIPVISAIGHEIDYTIADFVADLRAPTPSAAAELAFPLLKDLKVTINQYEEKLISLINNFLFRKEHQINDFRASQKLAQAAWRIGQYRQNLDDNAYRLQQSLAGFIADRNGILKLLGSKLNLLSPLNTLNRGYVLAYRQSGVLLDSVTKVSIGDELILKFKDGIVDCKVKKVSEDDLDGDKG